MLGLDGTVNGELSGGCDFRLRISDSRIGIAVRKRFDLASFNFTIFQGAPISGADLTGGEVI